MTIPPTIHASAVRVGQGAILIRGPSGSGKSRLAFSLIDAGRSGRLPPACLIGDDRVTVTAVRGRIEVRPAPVLAGLIEIYGLGLRRIEHEAFGIVDLVVDLAAADASRLPLSKALVTEIEGIPIDRLPVAPGHDALLTIIALRTTQPGIV